VHRGEDEAVAHGCRIGFHRETGAYIDFLATLFPDSGAIIRRLPLG
jgi:hypothetical protein